MSSGIDYPEGIIMCQLCFCGFYKNELWEDFRGDYWDVCKQCKAEEFRHALVMVKHTVMNHPDYDSSLAKAILQDLRGFWDEI